MIILAAVSGFTGDQIFFTLGRHHGARILARYPDAAVRAAKFDAMLSRWHAPLIIGIRFMYGFRIVGPVLLGMGRVKHSTFALYNAIGALIWAPLIAGLGYLFGEAIESVLHDVKDVERFGLAVLLIGGLVFLLRHRIRERQLKGSEPFKDEKGTDQ